MRKIANETTNYTFKQKILFQEGDHKNDKIANGTINYTF